MASKRWITLAGFALGFVFLTGGALIAVLLGWPMLETARASAAWPTAEGEITASQVEELLVDDTRTVGVRVAYRYAVGEEIYDGTNIRFGGDYRSTNPAAAEATVAQYPVGQAVTVHYDPLNPATSVLEPGGAIGSYAVLTLGIAVAAIGLVLVIPLLSSVLTRGGRPVEPQAVPAPQNPAEEIGRQDGFCEFMTAVQVPTFGSGPLAAAHRPPA